MQFGFTEDDFKDDGEFTQTLKDGRASGKAMNFEEGVDKQGNPRITFDIETLQNGKHGKAKEFVSQKQKFKLINLAKASNSQELRNAIINDEHITANLINGLTFEFEVQINGSYANVGRYIRHGAEPAQSENEPLKDETPFNDDIPF